MTPCCRMSTQTSAIKCSALQAEAFISVLHCQIRIRSCFFLFPRPPFYCAFSVKPGFFWRAEFLFLKPANNLWFQHRFLSDHFWATCWHGTFEGSSYDTGAKVQQITVVLLLLQWEEAAETHTEHLQLRFRSLWFQDYRKKANSEARPWALHLHPFSVRRSFSCRVIVTLEQPRSTPKVEL